MTLPSSSLDGLAADYAARTWLDVRPRHHAGPGDPRHLTHTLVAAGWTPRSDPLSPHLVLRSPDGQFGLEMSPSISPGGAWWWLREHPTPTSNGWWAEFGDTPVEILGHVTDALALGLPLRADSLPSPPLSALAAAGWGVSAREAVSPDRCCRLAKTTTMWSVRTHTAPPPSGRLVWHATLRPRTPPALVSALAAGLADPAPVQRSTWDRTVAPSVRQEPSLLSAEQIVAAHTERVHALRVRPLASRPPTGVAPLTTVPQGPELRTPRSAHAG